MNVSIWLRNVEHLLVRFERQWLTKPLPRSENRSHVVRLTLGARLIFAIPPTLEGEIHTCQPKSGSTNLPES